LTSAVDDVVVKGGWHVLESLLIAEEVTLIGSYIVHWNPESFCLEHGFQLSNI
jgi:hypothetical protein